MFLVDVELIWTNSSEPMNRQAEEKDFHSLFSWNPYNSGNKL